jgi:hypothetical protein
MMEINSRLMSLYIDKIIKEGLETPLHFKQYAPAIRRPSPMVWRWRLIKRYFRVLWLALRGQIEEDWP